MLLLLTIGLVIVALALLIVGFVQHTLALIYGSIACSAAAALTLIVFSRLTRRRSLRLGAAVPAELTAGLEPSPAVAGGQGAARGWPGGDAAPSGEGGAGAGRLDETGPVHLPPVRPGPRPGADGRPVAPAPSGRAGPPDPLAEEVGGQPGAFPIEDYDDLRSSDIVPLLAELEPEELLEVRAREEAGRGRRTVLRRVDALLAAAGVAVPPAPAAPGPATGGRPAPAPAQAAPDEEPVAETPAEDAGEEEPFFPIADYDELKASEILPLLPQLYPEELEEVAERERAGANRATVLNRISRLLGASPCPQETVPPATATAPGSGPGGDSTSAPRSSAPKVAAASKSTTTRRASTASRATGSSRRGGAPDAGGSGTGGGAERAGKPGGRKPGRRGGAPPADGATPSGVAAAGEPEPAADEAGAGTDPEAPAPRPGPAFRRRHR